MTLHLIQLHPDMPRLVRWATHAGVLARDGDDDLGYALHALLTAAFDTLAPHPFALLRDTRRPATLLAYTPHDATALQERAAAFALPEAVAALGLETLTAKAMPARFAVGRRLGFSLRVRPTVRTDRDGDRNAAREVDAFLAAVTGTDPGAGPERSEVYREWLQRRLEEGGAMAETLSLEAFRLSAVYRRDKARKLHRSLGPDASFTGTLIVREPDAFATMLERGVGRHRAFGFGMLLLRPA